MKNNSEEAVFMLEWISDHTREWEEIITFYPESPVPWEQCVKHIDALADSSMFTAVIYYVYTVSSDRVVGNAVKRLLLKLLAEEMRCKGVAAICSEFRDLLQQERCLAGQREEG